MKKYFAKTISDDFRWKNPDDFDVYLASEVLAAPPNRNPEKLRDLRARLKSGEYNGADIMDAWIAIDEYADLLNKFADNGRGSQDG